MNSRNRKAGMNPAHGAGYSEAGVGCARPMTEAEWQRQKAANIERAKQQVGATISVLGPGLILQIEQFQTQTYTAMEAQGFWDSDNTGEKFALIQSEISEALEADRKNIDADDKIPEFTGVEAELADAIIRICDFAGRHNLRLGEAIVAKSLYNLSRPYKHGKKY